MPKKELTRKEVADCLGVSVFQVFKLESEGRLSVRREKAAEGKKRERVWYDADQVNSFLSEYTPGRKNKLRIDSELIKTNVRGKIAQIAMPMFEEKRTLAEERAMLSQICAVTAADPLIIQQLYELWRKGLSGTAREKERERKADEENKIAKRHEWHERQREHMQTRERVAKIELRIAEAKLEAAKKLVEVEAAKKPQDEAPKDERKQA